MMFARLFGLLALLVGASLSAHELGGAAVRMTVKADRQAVVRVEVDPEHLPLSLNPFVGTNPGMLDTRGRVEAFVQSYMAHLQLAGGAPITPSQAVLESLAPGSNPRFSFQFSLPLPPTGQPLTWRQELPLGQYFFVVGVEGGGPELKLWMEGGKAREVAMGTVAPAGGRLGQLLGYVRLGFTHILPEGLDHILFVLGIFLLSLEVRSILWQVTAFTVAHSLTLGLSLYGVASLPPAVVEPLIALSIVAVAVENIWAKAFHWRRVAVVFAFGLLHGLGFAGALHDLGLPRHEFLTALLGFNIGVEAGQLSVVALAFLALGLPFGRSAWYRPRITVPASILIGAVGIFWTVQRVVLG